MKIFVSAFAALLSALACVPLGHAEAPSDVASSSDSITAPVSSRWTRLGPHIALSGGVAMGDLGREAAGLPMRQSAVYGMDTASGSIGVRGGYRFHPRFSAELLFDYQTGWEFRVPGWFNPLSGDQADLEAWNVLANVKLHLTDTQWQPYVSVGIGAGGRVLETRGVFFDLNSDENGQLEHHDEAFVARFGGGLDAYVTESVTFGGEVAGIVGSGELTGFDYAITSLVLAYRFP